MTEENSDSIWEAFPGDSPSTLALPDFYSNYFDYSFDRSTGDAKYIGLRVTGEFGYARYMSFNTYDAVEGSSYDSLTDFEIEPLPGNVNPYLPGSDASATNRSYSITVVPEEYAEGVQGNVLTFSDEQVEVLTVMLRYYVPKGGSIANVPLPQIEAFDVRTGDEVDLPTPYLLRGSMPKWVMSLRLDLIFATAGDAELRFFHAAGQGEFNNKDNMYLIAAVKRGEGEVLLLRILPPSYPRNNNEYGKTAVRYWSFNEGNYNSSTALGKKDEDFKRARDGFVYLAIGDAHIKKPAEARGYNFMLWRAGRELAVILYRNLVTRTDPPFEGDLSNVPVIEPSDLEDKTKLYAKEAKYHIGNYAPTGKKISEALFTLGSGGLSESDEHLVPPVD